MELAILIMLTSVVTMFILGTYSLVTLDQRLKRVERRLRKLEEEELPKLEFYTNERLTKLERGLVELEIEVRSGRG